MALDPERDHLKSMTGESTVESLDKMVDVFPLGIAVVDKRDHFRYVNQTFTEMFGFALADLSTIDHWLLSLFADDQYRDAFRAAWAEHDDAAGEVRCRHFTFRVNGNNGREKIIRFGVAEMTNGRQIPLRLGTIVDEVLSLLRAAFPAMIEIRKRIVTRDDRVLADPTKIHQVIMNLCTNAYHAMSNAGGVLEVAVESKDIDLDGDEDHPELEPGSYVNLQISDTGCGMSPEVIARSFEPYFTTTEQNGGTGLGLSLVKNIIERLNGSISVESKPGRGTAFSVMLPHFDGLETKIDQDANDFPVGCERILFIDDEPALADLGKRILEFLGYHVTVRTDSINALETFRYNPEGFDLIITDLEMPRMSGTELANAFLKMCPDIPVILCTGHNQWIQGDLEQRRGICGVVLKPLVIRDVAKCIRTVLERSGLPKPAFDLTE